MEAVGWEVFAAIRLQKRFDRGGRLIYVVFAFLGIVHGFEQTGWPLLVASICMSSSVCRFRRCDVFAGAEVGMRMGLSELDAIVGLGDLDSHVRLAALETVGKLDEAALPDASSWTTNLRMCARQRLRRSTS